MCVQVCVYVVDPIDTYTYSPQNEINGRNCRLVVLYTCLVGAKPQVGQIVYYYLYE